MDTILDILSMITGLACTYARELIATVAMVAVLAGVVHLLHGFQREQATVYEQVARPLSSNAPAPATTATPQKWCPVDNWPAGCQ